METCNLYCDSESRKCFLLSNSAEGCILDGEMVVWNCAREAFEAFGSLLSTMLAANNTAGYEDKDGRLRLDRDVRPRCVTRVLNLQTKSA